MRKNETCLIERLEKEKTAFVDFSLPGLLAPDHRLILHKEARILSLLGEGPCLLEQQLFSDNEMRVLLPILQAFPYYCPYEILLAALTSPTATPAAITRWRLRLQEAQHSGTSHQELRPIRRTLWSLRQKLLSFQLEISTVRGSGCSLTQASPRSV